MLAAWPEVDESLIDEAVETEAQFAWDVISAVRTIRSEMRVPPSAKLSVKISASGDEAAILGRYQPYVLSLARIGDLETGADVTRPESSATVVVGQAAVYVSLADLIDLDAERDRIAKEMAKVEGALKGTQKKLANASFVERAPEHVVQAERDKITLYESSLARLRSTLESIAG